MDDDHLKIAPPLATVRSMVEDKLREAIVSGYFKPGRRLVERELCELTGVGRTSIREALRQLEAEGLVTTVPHRGPVVSEMTYQEAVQLYEIRGLLEGFAGAQFALNASDQQITTLGELVEEFGRTIDATDPAQLADVKSRFYALLIDGAQNLFLRQMLTLLHNRIQVLRVTSMMQQGRPKQSIKEIRAIFEAIAMRDPVRSGEACRLHVQNAADAALAYLKASEDQAKDLAEAR